MATVEFASLKQIKEMRKTLDNCGYYVIVIDDKNIDSNNYFIIWDDDNNMLYTIEANTEMASQYYAPYKIKSYTYDWIEWIWGVFQGQPKTVYIREV